MIKEGSNGPIVAEFAFLRGVAVRDELPEPEVWVVLRRSPGEDPELKVYVSHTPVDTPVTVLAPVAGVRWPVETAIEEGKDALGMDHYDVRSWLGRHHHMTTRFGAPFPGSPPEAAQKGAPALTFRQARLSIVSILPLKQLSSEEALRRIRFVQKQDCATYLSHRKCTVEWLDGL